MMISRKSFFYSIFLSVFLAQAPSHAFITITNNDTYYNPLKLTIDTQQLVTTTMQSYTHLSHQALQDNVLTTSAHHINTVGIDSVTSVIKEALTKEAALAETHFVFYHGCSLEFMLFHDLITFGAETKAGKTFTDFFLLRTPLPGFSTYQTTQDFLQANNTINDSYDPHRKILLSVNPSLFGNTTHRPTSSAFCYFMESQTAFGGNVLHWISEAFTFYHANSLYHKNTKEIAQLYNLLNVDDGKKTGLLLQIFIPKDAVDRLVYRSKPRGIPFYINIHEYKSSEELTSYQANNNPINTYAEDDLDTMQFRILLSTNDMLDIENSTKEKPIKIFRYFNPTTNTKKYQKDMQALKKNLKKSLSKK